MTVTEKNYLYCYEILSFVLFYRRLLGGIDRPVLSVLQNVVLTGDSSGVPSPAHVHVVVFSSLHEETCPVRPVSATVWLAVGLSRGPVGSWIGGVRKVLQVNS